MAERICFLKGTSTASSLCEVTQSLLRGACSSNPSIAGMFRDARQVASKAVSENAEDALAVAALLCHPCQCLATGFEQTRPWTSDSLLVSGTYDWLFTNFGEDVAETIRLQPHARRYLSSLVPSYFGDLETTAKQRVFVDGGFMSMSERSHFSHARYYRNALKLSSWIDQGTDKWLELPEIEFFLPFVENHWKVRNPKHLPNITSSTFPTIGLIAAS